MGVIKLKVIMEKGGIQSRAINDKKGNVIQSQNARSVNRVDRSVSTHKKVQIKGLRPAPQSPQKKHFKVLNKKGVTGKGLQSKVSKKIKSKKPRQLLNKKQIAQIGLKTGKKLTSRSAKTAVNLAKKPLDQVKGQILSQRARFDKTEDSGAEAVKLGIQGYSYAKRGIKTGVNVAKTTAKTAKKAVQAAKKTAKIAKNTTQAAKKAAQAAHKAAQAAKKAAELAARAVIKLVSFIIQTAPWSLIIIGAIVLIIIVANMFADFVTTAGGAAGGGGGWLVSNNSNQTPEQIYEGYNDYKKMADEVIKSEVKDKLKDEITSFCSSDTTDPRKIIQYIDKNNDRTFYPASGNDSTINPLIDTFGMEDYPDYMSLLFVLMTREKQQADGVTDAEIYDFDFTKADFEEFMNTIDVNNCRWGETFVYKTTVETYNEKCPNGQCKRKTIPGCKCATRTNEDGSVEDYCGGHCPEDHTKLTVKLFTIKDYYIKNGSNKDYPEIYNFTENEKKRYEASQAIVQGLLDYWEGGE